MSMERPTCLADFTRPELIIPRLRSTSAELVIGELTDKLEQTGSLENRTVFLDAVRVRERLSPTSCAPGWALPHARLADLPKLTFALGTALQPLTWLGEQKASVKIVWLFAVPESETRAYLNLIASIARFSQNAVLVDQLTKAVDASAIFDVLLQAPLPASRSAPPEKSFFPSLAGR